MPACEAGRALEPDLTDHDDRFRSLRAEPSTDDGRDPARAARVAKTGIEARSQSVALRTSLDRGRAGIETLADSLASRRFTRVIVIGCGDSWIVGMAVRAGFERLLQIPLEAAEAFDYAHYGAACANPESLVIGLSAGGTTQIVLDGLDRAQARGAATIGVSNTPGSTILTRYEGGLLVHAERRGWPTQSSTAAAALLLDLAVAVAAKRSPEAASAFRAELDRLPALFDQSLSILDPLTETLGASYAAARLILFTGAGPHFATAAFGAAKIKELGPIHAYAQPLEEMHHYRAQKPGDLLFMVAPDRASHARALDTAIVSKGIGGKLIALLPEGEAEIATLADHCLTLPLVDDALAPLLYALPLHLFAYHFATARLARGLGAVLPFPEGEGA
jgi:glucosamine--fructose-6-phosphate aminotransferase (isomerizing)